MVQHNEPHYILTADIGGTHITAAIYNTSTQSIEPGTLSRADVYSKGSANHILGIWSSLIEGMTDQPLYPVSGLALSIPGPFDYENGICYIKGLNKYDALYGANIRNYLADVVQLSPRKVKFRNDAESTIAGEVVCGAGAGVANVMGVTLGTGFGSALHRNGQTIDLNLGSEPFKTTIADDYLSTRWFVKEYYESTGLSITGVSDLVSLAAESGFVRDIFKQFAINMSDVLMQPVFDQQPELLLICGNIARASRYFLPVLKNRLSSVEIRVAQLGELAALIGAANGFDFNKEVVPHPTNFQ